LEAAGGPSKFGGLVSSEEPSGNQALLDEKDFLAGPRGRLFLGDVIDSIGFSWLQADALRLAGEGVKQIGRRRQ